jgi:hypothetical protein
MNEAIAEALVRVRGAAEIEAERLFKMMNGSTSALIIQEALKTAFKAGASFGAAETNKLRNSNGKP